MKVCLLFSTLLFAVPATRAAEYINPWSDFWELFATDVGCSLQRSFSNARALEAGFDYGAEGQTFDRFMIWFYIPSHSRTTPGATYVEKRLYLSIYSEVYPKISDDQRRIESVHVNDIELHRENTSEWTSFREYGTHGKVAHEILALLQSNKAVTLVLGLSGGEVATVSVPSKSAERFGLWSKLLFTCSTEIGGRPE